ncbi:hypothetical protein GCM10009552_16060 [Rothia nasimurium]
MTQNPKDAEISLGVNAQSLAASEHTWVVIIEAEKFSVSRAGGELPFRDYLDGVMTHRHLDPALRTGPA